jgi:PAS domain S-box-containing protein
LIFVPHTLICKLYNNLGNSPFSKEICIKKNTGQDSLSALRIRAQNMMSAKTEATAIPQEDIMELVHELDTYQIELELQNEDLRNAQIELEQSRRRFSDLYDFAPVAYLTLSNNGKIIEANLTAADMLGLSRGRLLEQRFTNFIIPEDQDVFYRSQKKILATKTKQTFELRLRHEQGALFHAQLIAAVNIDNCDSPGQFRVMVSDINEKHKLESELKKTHDELERRVEKRTRELQQTHKQLLHSEKLSAIGNLSASIAHEFNNPLQGIMIVLKGIGKYTPLEAKEQNLVNLALDECHRMKKLISNLSDFYRPTVGMRSPVSIHECLDDLLMFNKKDFSTRKITIEKEYADILPPVVVVADQLKQVFLNLFNNAANACVAGGKITIKTEVHEQYIVTHIEDNGIGIDPVNIPHIFEPFFTTSSELSGMGLGLSVSYGIINSHGGSIKVKSDPGAGTIFSVFLPYKDI